MNPHNTTTSFTIEKIIKIIEIGIKAKNEFKTPVGTESGNLIVNLDLTSFE